MLVTRYDTFHRIIDFWLENNLLLLFNIHRDLNSPNTTFVTILDRLLTHDFSPSSLDMMVILNRDNQGNRASSVILFAVALTTVLDRRYLIAFDDDVMVRPNVFACLGDGNGSGHQKSERKKTCN